MMANLDDCRSTPNSSTTSLSAFSTTAIKDGHQGQTLPHGHHSHHHSSRDSTSSSTTLDAERDYRISRLPGLDRVATVRPSQASHLNPAFGTNSPAGYFDNVSPQIKERSTVGSASASGSVGGPTTWASGSIDYDADKMNEDQDNDASSTGGFSDENASLVGFGEGAGSTVSVPISTTTSRAAAARYNPVGSPSASKVASAPSYMHQAGSIMSGVVPTNTPTSAVNTNSELMDGTFHDGSAVDIAMQPPTPVNQPPNPTVFPSEGADTTANMMRDRLSDNETGRPDRVSSEGKAD